MLNDYKRIMITVIEGLIMAAIAMSQSGTLPVMYIETENQRPVTSKTEYIAGSYYIVYSGNSEMNLGTKKNPLSLEIRGRGHSSWKGLKKPYKIKLGARTSLLGMKKHKHWALLKFYEPTVAGLQLGNIMGMDWTASTRTIEVILNGDYLGLYLLTETNRIDKNRLNIYEQPNRNEDESTVPYGWLVEVDNYVENNQIKFKENTWWNVNITYHSPDTLSRAQHDWLLGNLRDFNTALYAGVNNGSNSWKQYIDVDAMARFFIIQEVLDNSDGFHGSFYLHKDMVDGARWVAGPLWDLSCNQRIKTDYTFRMKTSYSFTPHWIGEMIKDEEFCKAVKKAWKEFYPREIHSWMNYIDEHLLPCGEAFEQEKVRWNYTSPATLAERVENLKSALLDNIEWFNKNLPSTGALAVDDLFVDDGTARQVISVEYIGVSGIKSSRPFEGMNIKVTNYSDGTIATTKFINR